MTYGDKTEQAVKVINYKAHQNNISARLAYGAGTAIADAAQSATRDLYTRGSTQVLESGQSLALGLNHATVSRSFIQYGVGMRAIF